MLGDRRGIEKKKLYVPGWMFRGGGNRKEIMCLGDKTEGRVNRENH